MQPTQESSDTMTFSEWYNQHFLTYLSFVEEAPFTPEQKVHYQDTLCQWYDKFESESKRKQTAILS